jgi:hypothetical protein
MRNIAASLAITADLLESQKDRALLMQKETTVMQRKSIAMEEQIK